MHAARRVLLLERHVKQRYLFRPFSEHQFIIQPGSLQVNILRWRQKSLFPLNSDGFIATLLFGLFLNDKTKKNWGLNAVEKQNKLPCHNLSTNIDKIVLYSNGVKSHRAKYVRFNSHCGRFPKRLEKTYSLACNTGVSNL